MNAAVHIARHAFEPYLSGSSRFLAHTRGEWRRGLHLELQRLGPAADDPRLARVFDLHHCIGEYQLAGDTSFAGAEEYARRTLDLAEQTGARRACVPEPLRGRARRSRSQANPPRWRISQR